MSYRIRRADDRDAAAIMEVFNHYVEHSFAAYPAQRVPESYFPLMKESGGNYPVYVAETAEGRVIGFGMLRRHHRAPAFDRTAEIGYFILPEHTRKGVGRMLLAALEAGSRPMGIGMLLANISSLNENSIAFHRAFGFTECGRFRSIGTKFGREFDVVWMQKAI